MPERNYWLNGRARIWQRGTSVTKASADGMTADRIRIAASDVTHVVSRQAFATGLTEPNSTPRHFFRWAIDAPDPLPPAATVSFGQRIPGVTTLAGRHVFFQFWAKADRAISAAFAMNQNFGSGGSSLISHTGLLTFDFTTAWRPYGGSFLLPALPAAQTIGSDDYIWPRITIANTQLATAVAIDLANIALSPDGTVLDIPQEEDELAQCKWSFERIGGELADVPLGTGFADSTTHAFVTIDYTEKRKRPSIAVNGTVATDFELKRQGGAVAAPSAIALVADHNGFKKALLDVTTTGLTAGEAVVLKAKTTSGSIDVSAEIA